MKRFVVSGMIIVLFLLVAEEMAAQVVVRDSVKITRVPQGGVRPPLDKANNPSVVMVDGVVSGVVIPYRANLQIYYDLLDRLDWYLPPWASLITSFVRTDSMVADSLIPRFPEVTISPFSFFNGCLGDFEQHDRIFFRNFSASEEVYRFNAGHAEAGDTVQFFYDTEPVYVGGRDTLLIWSADEIRDAGGTLVGWLVAFQDYDLCLDTWKDRLEIFVGLVPSTIEMSFEPAVLAPGDTASIILRKVNSDGTREDFPPGQNFEIGIVKGSNEGGILSPTPSPVVSDYFKDFEQPFAFIAENNITADSVIVQVRAGIPTASGSTASAIYQEMRFKAQQQAAAYLKAKAPESAVRSVPEPTTPAPTTKKNFGKEVMTLHGKGGQRVMSDIPESEFVYSDFAKANIVIKQPLDHFAVTVTPDTIEHDETATLTVQAKDKNDNDITLPDNTLLDFALDDTGEILGNFIAPNGSQAKSLAGITYGDARVGEVEYIANGERPDSTQEVLISVSKSDDATKSGSGSVMVEGLALTIDIPDLDEIWPTLPAGQGGNPGNRNVKNPITIRATQNNLPLANQNVTISARIILPSGGHDHTNQPPSDSLGLFIDLSTTATGAGTITISTDANGQIQLSYRAPSFGGQIELTAQAVINPDTVVARDTLVARIPGFVELGAGPNYELVGAPGNHEGTNDPCRANPPTSQHNDNHFGRQALITAIQDIAAAHDSLFPDIRLRINDMSLENGGLFDINNNWQTPHRTHRFGRIADIGFTGIDQNNQCVNLNQRQLRDIITDYAGDDTLIEGDHYHITL